MDRIIPTITLHAMLTRNEGTYINALVLRYMDNCYHMQAQTTDTIHVFSQALGIYVLIVNKDRGYIGLLSYMVPEPDPINMVYLHSFKEIIETLGKTWEKMQPETMVRKLMSCLY